MRITFRTVALAAAALLAACASPPPADDPDAVAEFKENNDPLEPTNRFFYAVNDAVDTVILRPLALGYRAVLPSPLRTGIHNALGNLGTPVTLANDLLQGNPQRAKETAVRFVINSTVGAFGLFDIASDYGYPGHPSDFGMTLAVWGMPSGAYLFLPGLGPSNPRDAAGFGVDTAADPFGWIGKGQTVQDLRLTRTGVGAMDARVAVLDDFDKVKAQALDPYATIRSLARQYRSKQIDGARSDTPGSAAQSTR